METGHALSSHANSVEKLNQMQPGVAMHLEFKRPTHKRVVGKLLGYEKGKYLLVKLSDTGNWHQFSRHFYASNPVIVRCLDEQRGGFCLGFSSFIAHASYQPMNLLYIEYPSRVECQDLRRHPRLPTTLAGKISDNSSTPIEGILRDISLGGCRFEFQLPKGKAALASTQATLAAANDIFFSVDVRNQRKVSSRLLSVGLSFNVEEALVRQKLTKMHFPKDVL